MLYMLLMVFLNISSSSASASVKNHTISEKTTTPVFKDYTYKFALLASHNQSGKRLTGLNELMGGGLCVIDYDNDGWEDIFVVGGSGQHRFYGKETWWSKRQGNSLWRNEKGAEYTDVSEKAMLSTSEWVMGCAVGDLNADGYDDLIVTKIGGIDIFKNNTDGTFDNVTSKINVVFDEDLWVMSAALADYNGDGKLDIQLSNYIKYKKQDKVFEASSGYKYVTNSAFDESLYDSQSNVLLKNLGGFTFENDSALIQESNQSGRSKASRWLYINDDSLPDLLVINGNGVSNQLFINPGRGGKFIIENSITSVDGALGFSSSAIGDIDNDSNIDLLLSTPLGYPPVLVSGLNASRNSEKQTDIAWDVGLASYDLINKHSWGAVLEDFNGDGWQDVYLANGLAMPDGDAPYLSIGQDDSLLMNDAGRFYSVNINKKYKRSSRGVVKTDIDNDGMFDLIISHNNGFVQILKNVSESRSRWLGVVLNGVNGHSNGARVTLKTNRRKMVKDTLVDSSYLSQSSSRLVYYLRDDEYVVGLVIQWPDGSVDNRDDVVTENYNLISKSSTTQLPHVVARAKVSIDEFYKNLSVNQKRLYIKILSNIDDEGGLVSLLDDPNPMIRLEAIRSAGKKSLDILLSAIEKATLDADLNVRLGALDLIKNAESERAVSTLIELLYDDAVEVSCKAASVFQYFFKEEEAVIYRKRLAVKHLLKQLISNNVQKKICAVNALSEAEDYRAVRLLLDDVSHSNSDYRLAVIRALGYSRDQMALSSLIQVAKSSSEEMPVRMMALISLKRLNYQSLNGLVAEVVRGLASDDDIREFMHVLNANTESVVFNKADLESLYNHQYCKSIAGGCLSKSKVLSQEKEYEYSNVVSIVKNQGKSLVLRLNAIDSVYNVDKAKAKKLLLGIKISYDSQSVPYYIEKLAYFYDDESVKDVLWALFNNSELSIDARLSAAEVLSRSESGKVYRSLKKLRNEYVK